MRHHFSTVLACLLAASLAGCGGGSDDATKFAGTWTFTAGSSVTATCIPPAPPNPAPFDLTGQDVTITKVDNSHLRANVTLQAGQPACLVNFHVSGSTATADDNQSCNVVLSLTGTPTSYPILLKSWTLTISGQVITTALQGSVALCTAMGSGTLMPGSGGGMGLTDASFGSD